MNDAEMMGRHAERQAITASEKPASPPKVVTAGHAGLPKEMFTGRHRDRECRACGQQFTQYELSKAMGVWVASLPGNAQAIWNATITENALPLFCISCERRELGRQPKVVEVPSKRALAIV